MIISFSGIDGAGKSTQAELLANSLAVRNQCVFHTEKVHPARTYSNLLEIDILAEAATDAEIILCRFYLASERTAKLQAKLKSGDFYTNKERMQIALAAVISAQFDAREWQRRFLKRSKSKVKLYIYDRYAFDEVIYRTLDGLDPLLLFNFYRCFPPPDFAFWIDTPKNMLNQRQLSVSDRKSELFRDSARLDKLIKAFRDLAPRFGLLRIDGTQERKDMHLAILAAVKPLWK